MNGYSVNDTDTQRRAAAADPAVPVAVPTARLGDPVSTQVRASAGQSSGANTPPLSSPAPCRRGVPCVAGGRAVAATVNGDRQSRPTVGVRQRTRLRADLSGRDHAVLGRLAEHRYLTTSQVRQFAFEGHASVATAERVARRVLGRLERDHLVRRVTRRQGGYHGGSSGQVWQLAPAGARLLTEGSDTYRSYQPSERFLAHCLAVADVHLTLRQLTDGRGIEGVDVEVEPASWRRYRGLGGEARWLQPDLAAVVTGTDTEGSYEDRWFIEVDMGTESIRTLIRKCAQYEAYRASGSEQAAHGVFPLVLWVLHGDRRAERCQALAQAIPRASGLTPELFRIVEVEGLRARLVEAEGGQS